MEFKVNAQLFHSLLKKVSQCIPSRTTLDIARKFRIRIDNGVLYVVANNTMAFAEVSMDIDCQNNCSFTLYALEFVKVISKLEGEIKFTLKDGNKADTYELICKHPSGKVKFIAFSSEYFEEPVEFESNDDMYISHSEFHDAISKIKHCVFELQDSVKHSIYIDVYKDKAFFVSTNNAELSCIKKDVSCEKNMSILLNYDFIPLILSLINKNDKDTMMMIKSTEKRIYFFSSDFKASVACFASDMRYPNYKQVMSIPMLKDEVKVLKADIIKSLDRLSIATSVDKTNMVMKMNIEGDNMHLSATDGMTQMALEENLTVVGEQNVDMCYRIEYIKETIESIDCEYVRLQFGQNPPCIKATSAEKPLDGIDHVSICICFVYPQ